MMVLRGFLVLCFTGILGARFARALNYPATGERLKAEMDSTLNKMIVKNTAAADSLRAYHTLEQDFAVAGLTILRILRQKPKERFGSTQEEITKLFLQAHEITEKVGLVGPYLQAALGELSRLKSWRTTAGNNLDAQANQTYNNFGSLPYFCRKFFMRISGFEGLSLFLAAAQQKTSQLEGKIKDANTKLAKLLEFLQKNYREETKQAKNYANEVWNKEIRTIVNAEMFMEDNADMTFDEAMNKARAITDGGGSKLQDGYDWIRENEHYFKCAPFNGKDVFQAAKEAQKESGALVGISKGEYIAIANTIVLLIVYSM